MSGLASIVGMKVFVALIQHDHGTNYYVASSAEKLTDRIFAYVKEWWNDEFDEPFPFSDGDVVSDEDKHATIEEYFERVEGETLERDETTVDEVDYSDEDSEFQAVEIYAPRQSLEELTCARISMQIARVKIQGQHPHQRIEPCITAVREAVTQWVLTTKAGREAWVSSGEDFNIGDLSSWVDDPELQKLLKAAGVHRLEIETFSAENVQPALWNYDSLLVFRNKIEDAEEKDGFPNQSP